MSLLSMKYFICSRSFLSPHCVYSIHRNYDGANATSIATDTSCYSRSSIRNRLQFAWNCHDSTYYFPDSIQNIHFSSWNNPDSLWNNPFSNWNTDYSARKTNNTICHISCSNYYRQYSNWNRTCSNWNRPDSILNRQYSKWSRTNSTKNYHCSNWDIEYSGKNTSYTAWNTTYSNWNGEYSIRNRQDSTCFHNCYLFHDIWLIINYALSIISPAQTSIN